MAAAIILMFVALSSLAAVPPLTTGEETNRCQGVASYELELNTFWSKDVFDKHYPTHRPHAQWSKIIGRSHSGRYLLWSENKVATEGLREFAEKAQSTELDNEAQGSRGVFDAFVGPPINTGVGSSQVKFLIHPNYPKVSFVSRMVPSPDWFVGVNSLDLCTDGQWASEKTLDLQPMDSGTDRGFTFTSPNWPEEPQKPIHVITSRFPHHPASSFYYPELAHLPRIAQMKLRKVDLAWVETNVTLAPTAPAVRPKNVEEAFEDQRPTVKSEIKTSKEIQESISKTIGRKFPRSSEGRRQLRNGKTSSQRRVVVLSPDETGEERVDCMVSEWSDWSACSKTCSFGSRTRTRTILKRARNGGVPCPLLHENQLCGSMRNCGWQHFSQHNSR